MKGGIITIQSQPYLSLFLQKSVSSFYNFDVVYIEEEDDIEPTVPSYSPWNKLNILARNIFQIPLEERKKLFDIILSDEKVSPFVKWVLIPEQNKEEFKVEWIYFFKYYKENFWKLILPAGYIKKALESALKEKYNPYFAEIYFKHFS